MRDGLPATRAILDALDLTTGMRVADVGTGGGYFAMKMAQSTGPTGAVIATDIDGPLVARLRERVHRAGLDHVQSPYGQTSMYDAIAETARIVAAEGPGKGRVPQRSAVVVLTDGIDTRSRLTSEQVSTIASSIDNTDSTTVTRMPDSRTSWYSAKTCQRRVNDTSMSRRGADFGGQGMESPRTVIRKRLRSGFVRP